jgi:hypothetical protein
MIFTFRSKASAGAVTVVAAARASAAQASAVLVIDLSPIQPKAVTLGAAESSGKGNFARAGLFAAP